MKRSESSRIVTALATRRATVRTIQVRTIQVNQTYSDNPSFVALQLLGGLALFVCAGSTGCGQAASNRTPIIEATPPPSASSPSVATPSKVSELLLVGLRGVSSALDPSFKDACWRSYELGTLALYRQGETVRVEWLPLLWVPTAKGAVVYSELFPFEPGHEAVHVGRTVDEVQRWTVCSPPSAEDDEEPDPEVAPEETHEYYDAPEETVTERLLFASSAVACFEQSTCQDVELGCGGGGPSCTFEHRVQTSAGEAVPHTLDARIEAEVSAELKARWTEWVSGESLVFESDEPRADDVVCARWAQGPQETLVYPNGSVINSQVVEFPLRAAAPDWAPFTPRGQLGVLRGRYPHVKDGVVSDSETLAVLLETTTTRLVLLDEAQEQPAAKAIIMAQQADGALARSWFDAFVRWKHELAQVSPREVPPVASDSR